MKKVLSLFLTVALLFTLVPNVIASAEDAAAEPIKLAITADTVLAAHYENEQYGKTPHGSDTVMFFAQQAPNNYETGPLLYKTDLSGIVIPDGKVVTKVELFVYAVAEGSKTSADFTNNVRIFNASTNWDESTTYMKAWDTKYDNKSGLTPNISWDKNAENYSCQISDQPDATCSTSFKKFAASDTTPIAYSFDITPAFMAAYPGGTVTDGAEFSWIMAMTPDGSYRYVTVASKEHTNSAVHPYLEITLSDKPAMTVTDYETPANPQDSFELTTANPINECSVTVNGEAVSDAMVSVAQNKITLNYSWGIGEEYTVVVNATDSFGQTLPESTYTFTLTDSYIFPVAQDTMLTARKVWGTTTSAGWGGNICGNLEHITLCSRTGDTAREIGVLKTGVLTGIKEQLDSGKTIDKVELLAYLAPGSLAINTSTRFFPASSEWDESTINLMDWDTAAYQPKLSWADNGGGGKGEIDSAAVPTDTIPYNYPKVESGYVPVTYNITNTFNKAFEAGMTDDSVFSFMMAQAENSSTYNYVFLASSETANYAPVIKVTFKEKTVAVPKIVSEDFDAETGDFSTATEVGATIAAGTKIKAITQITNNTNKNDEIYVVVVAYKDGELKEVSAVSLESNTLSANATKIYTSKAITLEEGCDCIKAFVWSKDDIAPLSASKVINLTN